MGTWRRAARRGSPPAPQELHHLLGLRDPRPLGVLTRVRAARLARGRGRGEGWVPTDGGAEGGAGSGQGGPGEEELRHD